MTASSKRPTSSGVSGKGTPNRSLGLIPTGPDPQLQPATRDVIDGHRLLGEQRRVAKGVAAHQDADARFLGLQRQRRQQRPTFEKGASGRLGR